MTDFEPFHKTIVTTINFLPKDATEAEICRLFQLLRTTIVPKDHDLIINALEKFLARSNHELRFINELNQVIENLLAQKAKDVNKVIPLKGDETVNWS